MTSVIYDYIVYGSTDGNSDSQIAVVSYVATCHVCVATVHLYDCHCLCAKISLVCTINEKHFIAAYHSTVYPVSRISSSLICLKLYRRLFLLSLLISTINTSFFNTSFP